MSGMSDLRKPVLICQLSGVCIFIAAFFLPSCGLGPGSSLPGYICAAVALTSTPQFLVHSNPGDRFNELLVVLSGWVNPLVLLCLLASLWKRLAKIRLFPAAATLLCLAASGIFFLDERAHSSAPLSPLVGYYLWVVGTLLILAPEWLRWRRKSAVSCA